MSIYLSANLFIYLSIYIFLSIYLSIYMHVYNIKPHIVPEAAPAPACENALSRLAAVEAPLLVAGDVVARFSNFYRDGKEMKFEGQKHFI